MKIFFDCEMTGLHQGTTLISLGMVDEDGREFYAEFTDYDKKVLNSDDHFIRDHVIKNLLLNGYPDAPLSHIIYDPTDDSVSIKGNSLNIKAELDKWLKKYDYVEFIADVPTYDFMLLVNLLWDSSLSIPQGKFSPDCYNVSQDIQKYLNVTSYEAFDKNREELLKSLDGATVEGVKHNSLYDAKVCRSLYYALNSN